MIFICTPTRDAIHASTCADISEIIRLQAPNVRLAVTLGTYLPSQRTTLVRESLAAGASHIFFIDSDMRVPADALKSLLRHRLPIVAANYRHRQDSTLWTASKNGMSISSERQLGLQKVHSIGFGCALIKADVFRTIPEPWFANPYDGRSFVSEDVFFCHGASAQGIPVSIDHTLSQDVRHIASTELAATP